LPGSAMNARLCWRARQKTALSNHEAVGGLIWFFIAAGPMGFEGEKIPPFVE
jgi:hypothetical protein